MNIVSDLPCSSSTAACMASLYSCPSWKICPTSMPRAISRVPRPVGLGAPRVADIDGERTFEVAPPIRAAEVHVLLVGAADEVRQVSRGMVDIDLAGKADGPDETRFGPRGLAHAVGARHAQRGSDPRQLLRLHGV